MRAVPIMLLAAAGLTPPETQAATEPPPQPPAIAAMQLAAAETTEQDLKLIHEAFARLAAGDQSMVVGMLGRKLTWSATAARDVKPAAEFGLKGAIRYLAAMADAIRSGKYKLELIGIEPVGGGAIVMSRWTTPGGGTEECANIVQVANGVITAVAERAR